MYPRLAATAALTVVLLSSCAQPGPGSPGGATDDLDGSWRLARAGDADGPLPLSAATPVTLEVDGRAVSGRAACNQYGTRLERDGDRLRLGQVMVTEMACPPAVMTLEQRYLSALGAVDAAAVGERRLVLTGADVRLEFDLDPPVRDADLVGTAWSLESLLDGETAASVSGGRPGLVLLEDGTLEGETGCRSFRGEYAVGGPDVQVLRIDVDPSPEGGTCPPATESQDRQVLAVLGDGFRAVIQGDLLTVTAGGDLGLVFRAE